MTKQKAVRAGHVLSLIATTYFLIATSAEPVPVETCFTGVKDEALYEITLEEHVSGYATASEGLEDGIIGAAGASGSDAADSSSSEQRGCTGIDGLDTSGRLTLRLHDVRSSQPDETYGHGCYSFRAEPIDVPKNITAKLDPRVPEPGERLANAQASVVGPAVGCEGAWQLNIVAEGREGVVDPTAPPSESRTERWLLTRELTLDQVHFCDGLVDPSIRGDFRCQDTWAITIEEAP